MSTAELDIVIKTFELRVGVKFVRDLLRIVNSLQADLNDSDELFFEKSLLASKSSTLQSKLSQGLAKKVKNQIDDAQEDLARAKVSEVEEQEEEFFDLLQDEVDTSKALERKLTLEKKQK